VVKGLEVDAALRFDHYDTYGSSTTPKFGVKYAPLRELTFRGTWGKGFRAPDANESGEAGAAFLAATVPDPILCPHPAAANTPGNYPTQCSLELVGVQNSNPALKPEKSTNFTLGAIFEPNSSFNVSVDYYDIKIDQDIISAFEAGGLLNSSFALPPPVRGSPVTLPYVNANGTIANQVTPVGLIQYQPYPYVNASSDETTGIDLDAQGHLDLGIAGRLTAELNYTHIIKYDLIAYGVTYERAGTHGPSGVSGDTGNPKDRAVLTLTWEKGPGSIAATVNYISSFSVTDPSSGQNTCTQALNSAFTLEFGSRFPVGSSFPTSFCTVGSFTDVDLYGKYAINDHLTLHGSMLNAFNKPPPLDMVTYGGGGAYDAAMHQAGAVGRFLTVGATYKF
jgi:iron complex outermembrane receptor protein